MLQPCYYPHFCSIISTPNPAFFPPFDSTAPTTPSRRSTVGRALQTAPENELALPGPSSRPDQSSICNNRNLLADDRPRQSLGRLSGLFRLASPPLLVVDSFGKVRRRLAWARVGAHQLPSDTDIITTADNAA